MRQGTRDKGQETRMGGGGLLEHNAQSVYPEPFDSTQDRPFDSAQDRPFDSAQDRLVEGGRNGPRRPRFDRLTTNGPRTAFVVQWVKVQRRMLKVT